MRGLSELLILALFAATGCGQSPAPVGDLARERQRMVQEQLVPRGIRDGRVLAAMAKVPREEFVPADSRAATYEVGPLPIGYGQTISQPYIVAFMTEQLRLSPTDRVLEIGTGSGYQAAILAELTGEVYTIEIVAPLAQSASLPSTSWLQKCTREGWRRVQRLAGECAIRCNHCDMRPR